ncbi:FAD-dependent monooxygenase [Sphingobium phenoxybenzoativorans]|uniref:FAD-dependent monooxygenase n=1 Tax=Sphingobium phenoxybenzoativorans TaxID=1592790 RepID=A0A975K6Q0_9SPHN|nr:FAD-dependent monooxygenase [Sphingobium phenoxybenzoativorans]QUT05789.1 FAD-dependent monooxygenase [Sphingobium phenoxybenzoativorans]
MELLEVDVLVVGGGACGLTSSIVLSGLGIDNLVVEMRKGTSDLPKAHYYNQRTMEIFRQHGIAAEVFDKGMPMANCTVRYVTSLGGDGELDKRELLCFDAFGGGPRRRASERAAAVPATHLPQLGLEPILRRIADERGARTVRFQHEMVAFEQDAEGVTATIQDHAAGKAYQVRAKYMIGSDGGRAVGPALNIHREGREKLAVLVSAHITADISDYIPGDAMITHIIHPESRFRWGVFVPVGPQWSKHCPQWQFSFAYHPNETERLTAKDIVPAIRESMRLPDLDVTLHKVNEWWAEATVTPKFREGRIFLAGDAAHRVIPTSGLGLNTAIHDAHNLGWKLAATLKGEAGEELLDSYEAERLPACARNAEWSWFTFQNHLMVEMGLGLMPGAPEEANVQAIRDYLSDTTYGEMLRARAAEVAGTQRTEYGALGVELGSQYEGNAIVPDGSPAPAIDPMGDTYTPTTRPGHRLPHAWFEKGSLRISSHDLTGATERFSLITGARGGAWVEAAEKASATLGIEIKAIQVGVGCDYADASGLWDESKEIGEDGAVLVRPDNFVAYRSLNMVKDPASAIEGALRTVLSRNADKKAAPAAAKRQPALA